MISLEDIGEHVQDNQTGIMFDLLFALIWVGLVSVFFAAVDGPQWAYYLLLLTGIPGYYVWVYSWAWARELQQK